MGQGGAIPDGHNRRKARAFAAEQQAVVGREPEIVEDELVVGGGRELVGLSEIHLEEVAPDRFPEWRHAFG